MGPYVETTESAAPALLVLSTESILVRITVCVVDTPRDGLTTNLTRATWGARCGKSARRVLRGGTSTSGLTARLVPTHRGGLSGWLIKRGWSLGAARRAVVVFGGVGVLLLIPTIFTTNLYVIASLFALATFSYA